MKQFAVRVGLGLLAALGLYLTVIVGIVLASVIMGFTSVPRSPPVTVVRYLDCNAAHPSPECAALAKSQPAPSAK